MIRRLREKANLLTILPILLVSIIIINLLPVIAEYGDIILEGDSWLQGEGVDVYQNSSDFSGKYQCVELVQRLYQEKGWGIVRTADGGAKSIPEGSPGLECYKPGTGYEPVPGDLIIEGPTSINGGYGHVSVVDYIEGNVINAIEQNGARDAKVSYTYNDSNYRSSGVRGEILAILHAPKNTFQNEGIYTLKVLDNIHSSIIDLHSYTIEADVLEKDAISKITYTSWSVIGGEEHKVVKEATITNQNTIVLPVDKSEFGNMKGDYYTVIEVYDADGTIVYAKKLKVVIPQVQNISIEEANHQQYTIKADILGYENIEKVEIHTWSSANGDDDLVVETMTLTDSKLEHQIYSADHKNETGKYISKIYIYDIYGQSQMYEVPLAVISEIADLQIVLLDETQYMITGEIVDMNKIAKIEIETYTKDGGYKTAIRNEVSVVKSDWDIIIPTKSFTNQESQFLNTVYVTDIEGVQTCYRIQANYSV